MVRIEGIRDVTTTGNGVQIAVLDLQVSTVAELPDLGDMVESYKLQAGSIAQIIQSDTMVTLDDDGTWYPEQS